MFKTVQEMAEAALKDIKMLQKETTLPMFNETIERYETLIEHLKSKVPDYKQLGLTLKYKNITYSLLKDTIDIEDNDNNYVETDDIEFTSTFETKEELIIIIALWALIEEAHKENWITYAYYITDDCNFIGILIPAK